MPPSPLTRLRKLCLALPEAHEVEAWGEPTFRVRNKMFAMYASAGNHHGSGRAAVWCKAWQTADPAAVDRPLAIQATVRDVLDHEDTWRQVVAAAVETGVVSDEAQAAARLQAFLDAPSSRLVDALTHAPPGLSKGRKALHARLDHLLPP